MPRAVQDDAWAAGFAFFFGRRLPKVLRKILPRLVRRSPLPKGRPPQWFWTARGRAGGREIGPAPREHPARGSADGPLDPGPLLLVLLDVGDHGLGRHHQGGDRGGVLEGRARD